MSNHVNHRRPARRRGNVAVKDSLLRDDEELDIIAECQVSPGTPDRGPDFGCAGGYPGDPPSAEVISVRLGDGTGLAFETLTGAEHEGLRAKAIEQAAEDARDELVFGWDDAVQHVCSA